MVNRFVTLAGLLALSGMASADILYRDNFQGDVQQALSAEGWKAYGPLGANIDSAAADAASATSVGASRSGGKQDLTLRDPNVNAGEDLPGSKKSYGFIFVNNPALSTQINPAVLLYTEEYSITGTPTNFGWYVNNYRAATSTGDNIANQVAVKVAGQWFVNTNAMTSGGFNGWLHLDQAFSTDGSQWKALDFVPGASLDQDLSDNATLSGSLPAGPITAFGLYIKMGSPNPGPGFWARMDTFQVDGLVPEPATLGLLSLAALAGMRRSR
jgi:hypothetical protein